MTVFQAAEPALSSGPERTFLIHSQVVDTALAQPVSARIRCAYVTINEISDTTKMKSKPQAALQRIGSQSTGMILMSQFGPRNLLNLTPADQMKKTALFVGDPQIPLGVLSNGKGVFAGKHAYGNEPVILQVAYTANRSDPDSLATILEKRFHPFIW